MHRKKEERKRKQGVGTPRTPGALASCVLAAASGAAGTAVAVELALVTSRRLEPALLATRRILVPPPLPFFSLPVGMLSILESS